jgi:hypothetical protein
MYVFRHYNYALVLIMIIVVLSAAFEEWISQWIIEVDSQMLEQALRSKR